MRALAVAVTSTAAVLAGMSAAAAADLPRGYSGGGGYAPYGARTGAIVVYDVQPGVAVRAYWLPPWRGRRYFPADGEVPEIGRQEDLAQRGDTAATAEPFARAWSTSAAFMRERPRVRVVDDQDIPPPLDPDKPLK